MSESKMSESKKEEESEGTSRRRVKTICVLGGSKLGRELKFVLAASELGKVLGAKGINVVFAGGKQGLRGCAATSAHISGSKVLGVSINDLVSKKPNYSFVGAELRVSNFPERLGYMFNYADAFIALPGGLETLEGIANIAFWAKLNLHKKPLGLLNINGFYAGLLAFLEQAVEEDFISKETRRMIMSASTVEPLVDQLLNFVCTHEPSVEQADQPLDSRKRKLDTCLQL